MAWIKYMGSQPLDLILVVATVSGCRSSIGGSLPGKLCYSEMMGTAASTPSAFAGHRVDAIREKALRFFNADPKYYDLIFVSNATAAIKMVMEAFRGHTEKAKPKLNKHFWYGYHKDAHNSVVGVRESSGTHHCFRSDEEVEHWIDTGERGPSKGQVGLFAYPGQSNMTGRRLPLDWSHKIRTSGSCGNVYTLLDAAALATTSPIDLSNPSTSPDFMAVSFYKIFGFPNLGALLVRKASGEMLNQRRYFGGGTVDGVIVIDGAFHVKKDYSLHDQLEDGTLPFHAIFALDAAIDVHLQLFTSMKRISEHTAYLSKYLYENIISLSHSNGSAMFQVYNDASAVYGIAALQGATIAFNVFRSDGSIIPCGTVERLADEEQIYIRSGGLCNPGGIASYLGHKVDDLRRALDNGLRCSHAAKSLNGRPIGVVRVSLGAMSIKEDVDKFVRFVKDKIMDCDVGDGIMSGELVEHHVPVRVLDDIVTLDRAALVNLKPVGSAIGIKVEVVKGDMDKMDSIKSAQPGRRRSKLGHRWMRMWRSL